MIYLEFYNGLNIEVYNLAKTILQQNTIDSIKVDSLGKINDVIEIKYLKNVYSIKIEHGELINPILILSSNKKHIIYRNYVCNVNFNELRKEDINKDFLDEIIFGYNSNIFQSFKYDNKGNIISCYKKEEKVGAEKYSNPSISYKFYKNGKGIKKIQILENYSDSTFFFNKNKRLNLLIINNGDIQTKQKSYNQSDSIAYIKRLNQFISSVDDFKTKCLEVKNIKKPDKDVIKVLGR